MNLFKKWSKSQFNKKNYKLKTQTSRIKIEMIKLFINQKIKKLENIINANIAKDLE